MERILLVDSDLKIAETLKAHLCSEYSVECCIPQAAEKAFELLKPEIVLFCTENILEHPEVLKSLTIKSKTLAILKSSSDHRMQILLEAGITDWLVEPLIFEQLNWKLKFLLRKRKQDTEVFPATFELAGLKIQPHEHKVISAEKSITVTPIQMRLLIAFNSFPNRLMSRDWLRFKVWNGEVISLRSIDAHISKLKKILPELETHLESVYGKGYVWKTETPENKASGAN